MASIREQVGALEIIDRMRHEQTVIEENLNLPQRREAVAQKIRAHYQSNGIQVSQEMIDEGVRRFFDNRFTFEPPKLNLGQRALLRMAFAYEKALTVHKGRTIATFCFSAILACMIAVAPYFIDSVMSIQYSEIARSAKTLREDTANNINRLDNLVANVDLTSAPAFGAAYQRIRDEYERIISESEASIPESFSESQGGLGGGQKKLEELENRYQFVGASARRFNHLLDAYVGYRKAINTIDQKAITQVQNNFPAIATLIAQIDSVTKAIDGDLNPLQEIQSHMRTLSTNTQSILDALDTVNKFNEEGVLASKEVVQFISRFDGAFNLDSNISAEKAAQELTLLYSFYKSEVELHISNQPGVKTGVVRTYSESGSPSSSTGTPYLIVSSTSNKLEIKTPVYNAETEKISFVSTFGVSVTSKAYEDVKQDKLDDGFVDRSLMGSKPGNSFDINYDNNRVSPNRRLISAW